MRTKKTREIDLVLTISNNRKIYCKKLFKSCNLDQVWINKDNKHEQKYTYLHFVSKNHQLIMTPICVIGNEQGSMARRWCQGRTIQIFDGGHCSEFRY